MSEVRSLVVGCDGTWNEPEQLSDGKPAATNVVKFLDAMARVGGRQVKHYEQGVGTRAWESLPGGVYGYGLEKRVLGGYRFLRARFADRGYEREENKIFLIGFSRGAYTARRLSGLLAHSGLPVKAADCQLGWEVYQQQDTKTARALKREGRFFDVRVEMVGVWDTVKATNDPAYHDSDLCGNVSAGYHAMAVDERRKFFPILRWKRDPRIREMWFAGVHSDVGGGYAARGLSDIALRWMIFRALGHGLQFRKAYLDEHVKPSAGGRIHESLTGVWKPLGEAKRTIRKRDVVHRSVEQRIAQKPAYRPKNLPDEPVYWPPAEV